MPRMARVVIPGCPHHLTRRGNRRGDVLFAAADRVRSDPSELTARLGPQPWLECLHEPWDDEQQIAARLRRCTQTGRPAGGAGFLTRLEALLGRVLRAKKVGRPKNSNRPKQHAGSKTMARNRGASLISHGPD